MSGVETSLAILAAAVVIIIDLAVVFAAVRLGRGRPADRYPRAAARTGRRADREETEPNGDQPTASLPEPDRRRVARTDAVAHRMIRPPDGGLEEVLRGSPAVNRYNRAVPLLTWSFIVVVVLLIVSAGQLRQPVQPQVFATLVTAPLLVLLVHELMPPGSHRTARIVLEGSAAIAFLTMLVLLTGGSASPFFFLYALLVGRAALIARPGATLALIVETLAAYAVASVSGLSNASTARETLAVVGVNLTVLLLLAYSGIVVGGIQRRTRDAAIRLSTVDSLTDLGNRAFLFNTVEREVERGRRFGRGFCLLMMDVDGLKSINDRYGHYQGDIVLRGVAGVIKANLRGIDVAARYGGDEFVALLTETDPTGAWVVAEKIRQVASELTLEAGGQRITTSLSIGVVSYPEDGPTADELMIAADEAMYSSKRLGKNRVVGYVRPGDSSQPVRVRPRATTPGFRPLPREGEGQPVERGERR
jgi:diguanylate cyclase (GGDEF)-like protein